MIHTGLISITFRQLNPAEIISLVNQVGFEGIEWGGDIHVPHGDVTRAKEVRRMTADAGLVATSYGSYYEAGVSEENGLAFDAVLDAAVALDVPVIRIWAGTVDSVDADETYRANVVEDIQRIATLADRAGKRLAIEFHRMSLADTKESTLKLIEEISRENVRMFWQPPNGKDTAFCLQTLEALLPWLENVHVFQWDGQENRHPLVEGQAAWSKYLITAVTTEKDHYAMIEFVPDDDPDQFLHDADILKSWIDAL